MKRWSLGALASAMALALAFTSVAQARGAASLTCKPVPGKAYRFGFKMVMAMDMTLPAEMADAASKKPETTTQVMEGVIRQEVKGVREDGNYDAVMVYESMKMSAKMGDTEIPMPPMFDTIEGKEIQATLAPDGEIVSIQSNLEEMGIPSTFDFKQLFSYSGLSAPNKEVKVGDSWHDTQAVEVPFIQGKSLVQSVVIENTLEGFEVKDGVEVARINQDFVLKQEMAEGKKGEPGALDPTMDKVSEDPAMSADEKAKVEELFKTMNLTSEGAGTGVVYWDFHRDAPMLSQSAIAMKMAMDMPNPAAMAASETKESPKMVRLLMNMNIKVEVNLLPEVKPVKPAKALKTE